MARAKNVIGTITAGFLTGAAIGIAASGMTSDTKRRKVKRQAQKTARTVGDFARDITEMVRD